MFSSCPQVLTMIGWSGLGMVTTTAILALWFLKDGNRDALMDLLAHIKWN